MMISSPNIVGLRTSTAASRMISSFDRPGAVVGQVADAVLDHHDRAVDHQAEVDGAQAHQAAGDADPLHHRDGEEHRQRDGRGDDQARAEVAEEGEQDGDDQDRPLEQVPLDGLEHLVHQVGPLVDDVDLDAGGEGLADVSSGRASRARVTSREFSPIRMKPSPSTASPLPLAVTPPRRMHVADGDLADVADADRHALVGRDGDRRRSPRRVRARPTPWTRLASPARATLPPP